MNLPAASLHAPLYLCHSAVVKLNNFALIPSQARESVYLSNMGGIFFFFLRWILVNLGKTPHGEARGSHPILNYDFEMDFELELLNYSRFQDQYDYKYDYTWRYVDGFDHQVATSTHKKIQAGYNILLGPLRQ